MPDKFLIAPLNSGLQNNRRPWQIMDDAFFQLVNVYSWRGRVKKRPGSRTMNGSVDASLQQQYSRLRINVATTAAVTGNLGATVMPGATFSIGQMFSVGSTYFTVYQANGATYSTGTATATFDTATGTLTITGNNENPSTAVYFYPSTPVMHFDLYQQTDINYEQTIAFDTQFSYNFTSANGWQILGGVPPAVGSAIWTGTDANFYSSCNYRGANSYDYIFFVTNNVVADQIKYWDGATWTSWSPQYISTGNVIRTARIVIPFKDRLLLLNTTEQTGAGNKNFPNRVRFSQNGSPVAADAYHEDVVGKGGYIEAPTKEAITATTFIKDRLIVFFESSTWELVYTSNQVLPFVFQQLNSELGVESQNSLITFDREILGFGSTGIHASNGINIERIDEKIPDEIYDIQNRNNGPERVTGIRDYESEIVYWSYIYTGVAVTTKADTYPNQLLALNYKNGSWAQFDDSITALGYYQLESDLVWSTLNFEWQETEDIWYDPSLQSRFRSVVAGNQQGFTFLMSPNIARNASALQISNIAIAGNIVTLTIYNHNLIINEAIYIENVQGTTNLNNTIFAINSITDANTITIISNDAANTYTGGGTVTRISEITLSTKAFNFYNDQSSNIFFPEINFYFDKTENGSIYIESLISTSDQTILGQAQVDGNLLGNNILSSAPEPNGLGNNEDTQLQVWRNFYPMIEGQNLLLNLFTSYSTEKDVNNAFSTFQLHAILIHAEKTYPI